MIGITIFCRVIDNFGDIGVTWRLARMLSRMGISTELFVDRTDVMKEIVPEFRGTESFPASAEGVLVREWTEETGGSSPPETRSSRPSPAASLTSPPRKSAGAGRCG